MSFVEQFIYARLYELEAKILSLKLRQDKVS